MRALVISYHWPPREGVTAQRAFGLACRLLDQGWDVHVATGPRPTDESGAKAPFPESRVLEIRGLTPHRWYQKLTQRPPDWNAQDCLEVPPPTPHWLDSPAKWIRGNLFIPDARMGWIPFALRRLRTFLQTHPVDVLFSSGPPHSNTYVATRLAEEFGVGWVADFQDPWTDLGYLQNLPLTGWARKRHQALERRALSQATSLTCTSPDWAWELEQKCGRPVTFLPWGWEPESLEEEAPPSQAGERPLRLCIGGTLGPDRDYPWFWEALAHWGQSLEGTTLEVCIGGNVARSTQNSVQRHLGNGVRWVGNLPRKDWLRLAKSAWAHAVLTNREQPGRVPAKLFECAGTGAPVLIVGPHRSAPSRLGAELGQYPVHAPSDVPGLLDQLRREPLSGRLRRREKAGVFEASQIHRRFESLLQTAGTKKTVQPPG